MNPERHCAMTVLRQWLVDPWAVSMMVASAIVASGFVAIALGWQGLAAHELVPLQVPFTVSGVIAGLGLVGAGLALLAIQTGRRLAAEENTRLDAFIRDATRVLTSLEKAPRQGTHASPEGRKGHENDH